MVEQYSCQHCGGPIFTSHFPFRQREGLNALVPLAGRSQDSSIQETLVSYKSDWYKSPHEFISMLVSKHTHKQIANARPIKPQPFRIDDIPARDEDVILNIPYRPSLSPFSASAMLEI